MNNLKQAVGYQAVGKVSNGVITITATKPYEKGIITKKHVNSNNVLINNTKEMDNMRTNKPTGQTYLAPVKQPLVKKVAPLDVPQFMKDRTKRIQEQKNPTPKKDGLFKSILNSLL